MLELGGVVYHPTLSLPILHNWKQQDDKNSTVKTRSFKGKTSADGFAWPSSSARSGLDPD